MAALQRTTALLQDSLFLHIERALDFEPLQSNQFLHFANLSRIQVAVAFGYLGLVGGENGERERERERENVREKKS